MAWLSGYSYRKSIQLSRASGAVSNYQMKLLLGESSGAIGEDVDCGGHCLSTFNDIRFTTSDGTTMLDYWIESVTGTTPNQLATIWIEFDSIGTGATTFYMYYGNSSAAAVSSGSNTFLYFQDFNSLTDGDLNGQDSWSGSANFDVQTSVKYEGAKAVEVATGGIAINISRAISVTSYNMFIQAHIYATDASLSYPIAFYAREGSSSINGVCIYASKIQVLNSVPAWQDVDSASSTTWYKVKLAFDSANTFKVWINDVLKSPASNANMTNVSSAIDGIMLEQYADTTSIGYVDEILVGQYLATEPAWGTWSAAEQELEGGTTESASVTDSMDALHLVDSISEAAEAADTMGRSIEATRSIIESATATDSMDALHLVDYTTESAVASDSMEAAEIIRKRIRFPNLQGKHLSLKFESATSGSFAIYYLRHKMFKTRELTSDQKHPNTQGSHIGIKLSNSGSDAFTLMYVSEKMQLVTT